MAGQVFQAKSGRPLEEAPNRKLILGALLDRKGRMLDQCMAVFTRGPHSYTGEDTAEFQCHGSPMVLSLALEALYAAGAGRRPGEFTQRAFLNGKMDLAQAEAVMGLISASGEQARKAALAGSTGVLSRKIESIKQGLLEQAAHLAAWADFPEEDVAQVEEAALLEASARGRKPWRSCSRALIGDACTGRALSR